jgi:RNA polymerase sigma-70 factor (ECF subfamily)
MAFNLFGSRPQADPAAFEKEALVHMDVLFRTARRMTGSDKDAEDLVQETFTRAYRFWHQFQAGTNCRAWLMRILHNVHINFLQKKGRTPPPVSIEASEDFYLYGRLADGASTADPSPEQIIISEVWDHEILDALDRLPAEFREVLVLSDVEEMAYKDIATALNVPIGTVRSRLARGRRLMQKFLWDYMKDKRPAKAPPPHLDPEPEGSA